MSGQRKRATATKTKARTGSFDELLADRSPAVAALARAARRLVLEVHPEAVEVVRLGDGAATYGLGERKMIEGHTYVMPLADRVNLGFYQGARLPDPAGLLEGTGRGLRHVKVRSPAELEAARPLVAAALAERRAALARG